MRGSIEIYRSTFPPGSASPTRIAVRRYRPGKALVLGDSGNRFASLNPRSPPPAGMHGSLLAQHRRGVPRPLHPAPSSRGVIRFCRTRAPAVDIGETVLERRRQDRRSSIQPRARVRKRESPKVQRDRLNTMGMGSVRLIFCLSIRTFGRVSMRRLVFLPVCRGHPRNQAGGRFALLKIVRISSSIVRSSGWPGLGNCVIPYIGPFNGGECFGQLKIHRELPFRRPWWSRRFVKHSHFGFETLVSRFEADAWGVERRKRGGFHK